SPHEGSENIEHLSKIQVGYAHRRVLDYSLGMKLSRKAFHALLTSKVSPNLPFTSFSFTNSVRFATDTEMGISIPGKNVMGMVSFACATYIGVAPVMLFPFASMLRSKGSV